jgi:pimeloyl-ACP methyl ester carboxylesterase
MSILKRLLILVATASTAAACVQSNLTTGTQTDGAAYVLYMPETSCWNGNLVVFAHGYVAPGLPIAVPQDQLVIGGVSLPATFNQLGYGFAASSYSKNGLAIVQGVNDSEDLVQNILRPQLKPNRVYLVGASEGGLVTVLSAEQLAHVYNAAGAACGPIGNFQAQINYLGDFRVIFDYFFPGVIPGSPVDIPTEVMTDWVAVYQPKITAALEANPSAAAQLIKVTGAAVTSDPTTVGETVLDVLWYNVFATNDATSTLGGQPYDNHNRIYVGSSNDVLLNLNVERFTASPTALAAVAAHYETSGRLTMPTVTLHTTLDPIIPYWHEPLYTLKTLAAGALLQRTSLPVANYGHCAFSGTNVLTAFALIVFKDTGLSLLEAIQKALVEPERSRFAIAARGHGLP